MEDEINPPSSNLVPMALAALAIVLGCAGLYFGLSANQRLNPLNETVEAGTSSAARIEKQLERFESELTTLSAQADELKRTVDRVRVYGSQSDQLAKQAVAGVSANRDELVKLVEKINEFTTSSAPRVKSVESSTSAGSASEASAAAAGTYSIQSGDSFAKIAARTGVSLQALLDANSGVDPRRLQIGQQITLPAN